MELPRTFSTMVSSNISAVSKEWKIKTLRYMKNLSKKPRSKKFSILCICMTAVFFWASRFQEEQKEDFYRPVYFAQDTRVVSSTAVTLLPLSGSIFCWVLTSPMYFKSRVPAVNETWLKRCDHGQFFTTEPITDDTIPYTTVFFGFDDSYLALFHKTINGFYYAYTQISDKFDWYMKADDDSYVIMENLREYLAQLDPQEPYYLGYTFKPYLIHGYNSGGAGYILSNKAAKIFVEELYHDKKLCPFNFYEDVGMSVCLANKEIFPKDTRNNNSQHRFSPYSVDYVFNMKYDNYEYTKWPQKRRFEAFAPELITLHHQTPEEMRLVEVVLYKLKNPRFSKFYQDIHML